MWSSRPASLGTSSGGRSRGLGVARTALRAALAAIRARGGGIAEAFPFVGAKAWWPDPSSLFEREGFRVHARLGDSRLLMRKTVRPSDARAHQANRR